MDFYSYLPPDPGFDFDWPPGSPAILRC